MSGLPQGWVEVDLEEIAIINPGRIDGLSANSDVSFVPMPAVSDVDGEIVGSTVRPFAEVSAGYTQFREGDVIFAKITPCMENGKIAVARSLRSGVASGSTEFHVVRPIGENSPDFIWRFLRQKSFRDDAEASMTGAVGQRRVPAAHLKSSRLPLPPLQEQRRIVAKVAEVSRRSSRARDRLDHIPRLTEKYKQAVLTAAFQGRLTKEWRERSGNDRCLSEAQARDERRQLLLAHDQRLTDAYDRHIQQDARPFNVPDEWRWVCAEAVCGFITKGTTPAAANMNHLMEGVPFLKVYNLTFDGNVDFSIDPTFISKEVNDRELRRSRVFPGDVLMNIVGPPLGKVGIVPGAYAEWNINQAIAVFRPIPSVQPAYLARWFLTSVLTTWAVQRAKATSGQSNLTLEICRNLPVPLCSVQEQIQILNRIDTAFAWIDRLAAEATSARKLIDHLDQAILAKAFRGELVPQDPNDEPASVLLERIRAERAAVPAAMRGRRKASA